MTGNILISWTLMHAIFAISILPHMVETDSFRKLHYLFIFVYRTSWTISIENSIWWVRFGTKWYEIVTTTAYSHSYSYSHTHETLWIFISAMMKNSKLSENVQNMSAQRHLSKCNGKFLVLGFCMPGRSSLGLMSWIRILWIGWRLKIQMFSGNKTEDAILKLVGCFTAIRKRKETGILFACGGFSRIHV